MIESITEGVVMDGKTITVGEMLDSEELRAAMRLSLVGRFRASDCIIDNEPSALGESYRHVVARVIINSRVYTAIVDCVLNDTIEDLSTMWCEQIYRTLQSEFTVMTDTPIEPEADGETKIIGYRPLSKAQQECVNDIKGYEADIIDFVKRIKSGITWVGTTEPLPYNEEWLNDGKKEIQKAFMTLVRAITRPDWD